MTYYEVLQVLPTASPEVIKTAYRTLARKYHPDLFRKDEKYAEEKMMQLNEAYRVLSSPDLRQQYDNLLQKEKEQSGQSKQNYQVYQSKVVYQPYQSSQVKQTSQSSQQPQTQNSPSVSKKQPSSAPKEQASSAPPKRKIPILGAALIILLVAALVVLAIDENAQKGNVDAAPTLSVASTPKRETPSTAKPATTLPTKPTSFTIKPTIPPAEIPQSGEFLLGAEYSDGSKLTVTASSDSSYLVKLKTSSGDDFLSFYVRAGERVTVGVPADYFYVYFASGSTWYGEELLFGEDTYYSKDDELLNFANYSYEYTLYPVTSGNFTETPIDPDEF